MTSTLPEHAVAMVRRLPPIGAPVVPGTTPVISFGDASRAEVATLGINPSAREFVEHGRLLQGEQRRLATLDSLGAEGLDQLTDAQVAAVLADCAAYFERRPYRQWFDPLDKLMKAAVGASYYDRSACHLDLIQWATEPLWGKIRDSQTKRALLDDGVPHLRAQLAHENVRLILLNGRQVLDEIQALGLAALEEVGSLRRRNGDCRLYVGTGEGVRWLGWSTNLQSSWGVTRIDKQALTKWVEEACQAPVTEPAREPSDLSAALDAEGHLPRGLRLSGKTELAAVLRRWLAESDASTLGDVGSFGGRAWLRIDVGGVEVVLNADTKRGAVIEFLNQNASEPERPWRVVASQRGRFSKVIPGPTAEPLPGWYAYLTAPRSEPGEI